MLAIEDEDVWTQLCKRDSELHKLCNKPVDWYDDWQQIFGKDRATGEHADGPADILENLSKEDYEVEASSESPANERKKKKMKLQDDLLVSMEKRQENIGSFLNTTTQLGILTQKMGHKHDLAKARREIYGIINNIDSLIKEEKLIDASKIVNEPDDVDLFSSLPEEMRKDFVRMKLGGRI